MMEPSLAALVRSNILALAPYRCARHEFCGAASVFLDANESPYGPYNRYPDPLQKALKQEIARVKGHGLKEENIFLGHGSDEAIDLLYRVFCEPKEDNVVAICPTYGMYEVCANINNVEYRPVLLNADFSLSAERLLAASDEHTKIVWLCSPNNPSGNSLSSAAITTILGTFPGLVVIDEAYVDFAASPSFLTVLARYPRLVILQTMSKAWAAAALRLGMAFAAEEIVALLTKVKYPYNVSMLTQQTALTLLQHEEEKEQRVSLLLAERAQLVQELQALALCEHIVPSDANFLLVRFAVPAREVYDHLAQHGIIVRDRAALPLCDNMLRLTVGTHAENAALLHALRSF